MTTEQIKIFREVYSQNSFTKAAEKLYTSRNTCMRAISSLETELSCMLFRRSTKGIEPTREGNLFWDRLEKNLPYFEKMLLELSSISSVPEIRCGISGYDKLKYTASVCIEKFNTQSNGCKVRSIQLPREKTFSSLDHGDIDILFYMLPPDDGSYYLKELISIEYMLLVRKDDPLSDGSGIAERNAIIDHPFIFTGFSDIPVRVFEDALQTDLSDKIVYRTTDIVLIFQLVSEGRGAAVLIPSDANVGTSLNKGLTVLSIHPKIECRLGLICKEENRDKLQSFIDYVSTNYLDEYRGGAPEED